MRSFDTDISNVANSGTQLKHSVTQKAQKESSRQSRGRGRGRERKEGRGRDEKGGLISN